MVGFPIILIVLGLTGPALAIRETAEFLDIAGVEDSSCAQDLRPHVQGITVTDLFRPVLEGTYRIRSHGSGESYLSAKDGSQSVVLLQDADSKKSYWKIRRSDSTSKVGLLYEMENKDNGMMLNVDRSGVIPKMILQLAEDGIHFRVKVDDRVLQSKGDSVSLGYDSNGPEVLWNLEWVEGCVFSCIRNRYRERVRQWEQVANVPIWFGAKAKWSDMCGETDQNCAASYAQVRGAFEMEGRIEETKKTRVVTSSTVRSVCDMPMNVLLAFSQVHSVLKSVSSVSDSCSAESGVERQASFQKALEAECFDPCHAKMKNALEGGDLANPVTEKMGMCSDGSARESDAFYLEIVKHDECATLPSQTLEYLYDHSMKEKCWTWHPKSSLWVYNDHGPNDVASMDKGPVCKVDKNKGHDMIRREGICSEGTTCQCPRAVLVATKTTGQLRGDSHAFAFDRPGGALLASLISGRRKGLMKKTQENIVKSLLKGGAFTATGLASKAFLGSLAPFATYKFVFNWLIKQSRKHAEWRCEDDLGCWPEQPKKTRVKGTRRACRMPNSAKNGGSPLYFLPPPGLMLKHRKRDLFRRCMITTCDHGDIMTQKVGFGRSADTGGYRGVPNVYNCQPLNFEDMDSVQKGKFVQELSKTVRTEHDLSALTSEFPLE